MIIIEPKFKKQTYLPNDLYQGEVFLLVTSDIVPNVFDYYMISNYGRVFHRYLNRYLKPGINGAGYMYVMMSTYNGPKPIQIHRLEMIAFNPIQGYENLDVNHKDGNKLNIHISNLEWATRSENQKHAYMTGLHKPNTNLTEDTVRKICSLLHENKYTNSQIANIVGVTTSIVADIRNGQSWTNISNQYAFFFQRPGRLFTDEMITNICVYFANNPKGDITVNDHCRNALRANNYNDSDRYVETVRKIFTGKYYTKISSNYTFY